MSLQGSRGMRVQGFGFRGAQDVHGCTVDSGIGLGLRVWGLRVGDHLKVDGWQNSFEQIPS